jgi:hypothetical protein
VNFSVPDEVKAAFDAAFKGRNKSAIIAALMRRAVAEQELQQRREQLFARLTQDRARRPPVSAARSRALREAGRP